MEKKVWKGGGGLCSPFSLLKTSFRREQSMWESRERRRRGTGDENDTQYWRMPSLCFNGLERERGWSERVLLFRAIGHFKSLKMEEKVDLMTGKMKAEGSRWNDAQWLTRMAKVRRLPPRGRKDKTRRPHTHTHICALFSRKTVVSHSLQQPNIKTNMETAGEGSRGLVSQKWGFKGLTRDYLRGMKS